MPCLELIAAILFFCELGVISSAPATPTTKSVDLLMPGVRPQTPDTYLCQAFKLDDNHAYITSFTPKADSNIAHHILLYGCELPGRDDGEVWNCGEMASDTSSTYKMAPVCASGLKIVYAWAMDAPMLTLPPEVSFDVGQDTSTKHLVLQVHYKNVTLFLPPESRKDNSGLTLQTTTTPTKNTAGVYFMGTGGYIPAHTIEYFEVACPYTKEREIIPFAYRTHAHTRGRVISGYRIRNGDWTEIGRKDPRLPEMFYNVTSDNLTIKKGDILAARCTMENTLDRQVNIGSTQNDEMCNFYIMYYQPATAPVQDEGCFTAGPPNWFWSDYENQEMINLNNLPDTASVIPGQDQPLVRNATRDLEQEVDRRWTDKAGDWTPLTEEEYEELAYIERSLQHNTQQRDAMPDYFYY